MTDQLRTRLLPAITIVATGQTIVGKRGQTHSQIVPEGTIGGSGPDATVSRPIGSSSVR
jgi:hypothetical protein